MVLYLEEQFNRSKMFFFFCQWNQKNFCVSNFEVFEIGNSVDSIKFEDGP